MVKNFEVPPNLMSMIHTYGGTPSYSISMETEHFADHLLKRTSNLN